MAAITDKPLPQELNLSALRDAAAIAVWESGAVAIAEDLEKGAFKLQVHRDFPDAPLSPVYLSLRPKGIKTGMLLPEHFMTIGRAMAAYAQGLGLFDQMRYVAGIPAAGEPFVDYMSSYLDEQTAHLRRFKLTKEVDGDQTHIAPPIDIGETRPEAEMQTVLLVDDLVTGAGTKLQAVNAVKYFGARVTDLLVFVDRSGGQAAPALAEVGVRFHAVWDFNHLLEFWAGKGYFGPKDQIDATLGAISAYPAKLAAYKAANS